MDSFNAVWNCVLSVLKDNVSQLSYDTWIKIIKPLKFENNEAFIYVQSNFQKGIIENQFLNQIKKAFLTVMGFDVEIKLVSEEDVSPKKREALHEEIVVGNIQDWEIGQPEQNSVGGKLNEELTFDNFIVGDENKFAHAAALAVANNPAGAYNPFFIWGKSGLGKTHLLSAIANEIKKNNPKTTIMFVKGEEFTHELIQAIKNGEQVAFRNKYRYVDVFLIDDLQFISGKVSTEIEFFHTFEALYEAKKQIIVTSDKPPKEMITLEERIKTRLEQGLIADIQPPEYETRVAIIKNKAEQLQLELSDNVIEYIASKLKNNIRELEGAVKKIKAYSIIYFGQKMNQETVQGIIQSVIKENVNEDITPQYIIDHVARYTQIDKSNILGDNRRSNIMQARQIAMYIIKDMLDMPLQAIGEEFGGKNHSTVLHSINKVEENIEKDVKFKNRIEEIKENIKKDY